MSDLSRQEWDKRIDECARLIDELIACTAERSADSNNWGDVYGDGNTVGALTVALHTVRGFRKGNCIMNEEYGEALRNGAEVIAAALKPFAELGCPSSFTLAYHDLHEDTVVFKDASGRMITAGDVRNAVAALAEWEQCRAERKAT